MDEENSKILLKERYTLLEWSKNVELRTPNLLIPVQIANYVESLPFCKLAVSPKCDRLALMSYSRLLDIYLLNGEVLDHESSVQVLEESCPEYCILQFSSTGQLLLSSRSTPHIDIFDSMGAYCYDIALEPHEGIFDVNAAICSMQTVAISSPNTEKFSEILYVLQYSGTFSAFKIGRLAKYTNMWSIQLDIGPVGTFHVFPLHNLLLVTSHYTESSASVSAGLCSYRMIDTFPYVEPIRIATPQDGWFTKIPFSASFMTYLPRISVSHSAQHAVSVSTSGSLFLFEIPSTDLKFSFHYINGPRPVEACFVDTDEIAIIYDDGVLLRCSFEDMEEKMFSRKIAKQKLDEDMEEDEVFKGQTVIVTPKQREMFVLSAEGDSSIYREAAHKRVQLAGQLWMFTVWNSFKKLVGMMMGESAEPLQMATHLARFDFCLSHSPTRTLEELFDRTLCEHDYTRARELATTYDTIDIDIVLKAEWMDKCSKSCVDIHDVGNVLGEIRDSEWVVEQCLTTNCDDFEVLDALIRLGLSIETDADTKSQLVHHQKLLEVCQIRGDIEVYLGARHRTILDAALIFANISDIDSLYRLIETNLDALAEHQRRILSAIPSCTYPTKYEHLLPRKNGEKWEIYDENAGSRNEEHFDVVEWVFETIRKIDFECGMIGNCISLLKICSEKGYEDELADELHKWQLYADYTRICTSVSESISSFETCRVEAFVARFSMLLESELISNVSSIIALIEWKVSTTDSDGGSEALDESMKNLMCRTNEKSITVLSEFRKSRPDLITDAIVLDCLMNMTITGGDLLQSLGNLNENLRCQKLDISNITFAVNSLMSRGVKMTFKTIFESMKEPDAAKRVLIKLSRSGNCENVDDWTLLRDDVLEMAAGIYSDLVTRDEALQLVAKELLESDKIGQNPQLMELVLTLSASTEDAQDVRKLSARQSAEVLLAKSEELMAEATHKNDALLGKSRFFAIAARGIAGGLADEQLKWLDAIELAQELGCTIMPIAIKLADHDRLLHDLVHISTNYRQGKKLAKLAVLLDIDTPVATALSLCALAALNHNDSVYLNKYIGEVIKKTKGLAVVHQLCMRIMREKHVLTDMADVYFCAMNNCSEKNMLDTLDAIAESDKRLAEAENAAKTPQPLETVCKVFTPDPMYCTVECYKSKNLASQEMREMLKNAQKPENFEDLTKLMAYESSSLAMCYSLFAPEPICWTQNEKLMRYEKSLRYFETAGVDMQVLTRIMPMKVVNAAGHSDKSLTAIDRIEDYGCDKNRFIGDRQYRDDAIVGLAITENDQQFNDALELAEKYNVDEWQLHMASLENALCCLPLAEVKRIIKTRQHLPKLRQNVDLFHAQLRAAVLPLLATNEQFLAYCSLFAEVENEKKAATTLRKICEKRKDVRAVKMWQDAAYLATIIIGIPDKVLWSMHDALLTLIPVGREACERAARQLLDGTEIRPPAHALTLYLLVGQDVEEFLDLVAVKNRNDEIEYLKNALILLEATPKTPKHLISAVENRLEKMLASTTVPSTVGTNAASSFDSGMKMRRKN